MDVLLTREQFRRSAFERDGYHCVLCHADATEVHHIMERRLFADGGYYLNNAASVCNPCHLRCEQTLVSVEEVREAAGIREAVLPDHLYRDQRYDKWGNPILDNGARLRGELFDDPSVQKVLAQGNVLHLFVAYVKYPRTYHLPWSPGMHDDDRIHTTITQWEGREIVVTMKMDGENTTLYPDYIHARSINSGGHPSRAWVKAFHARMAHDIPLGWRVCGENLYATHSIHYETLPSYFLGFALYDERNICLSWDETTEWFTLLGVTPVATLYRGIFDRGVLQRVEKELDYAQDEGYVLRVTDGFHYKDHRLYVGKLVRPNHIQTVKHWFRGQAITPNKCTA